MTLRRAEADVDVQRVNFASGETERGRSDPSRPRFAIGLFSFRDLRSRAHHCYVIERCLRYGPPGTRQTRPSPAHGAILSLSLSSTIYIIISSRDGRVYRIRDTLSHGKSVVSRVRVRATGPPPWRDISRAGWPCRVFVPSTCPSQRREPHLDGGDRYRCAAPPHFGVHSLRLDASTRINRFPDLPIEYIWVSYVINKMNSPELLGR